MPAADTEPRRLSTPGRHPWPAPLTVTPGWRPVARTQPALAPLQAPKGKKFDSSYDRGSPSSFAPSGVVAGWTEAMQLMARLKP